METTKIVKVTLPFTIPSAEQIEIACTSIMVLITFSSIIASMQLGVINDKLNRVIKALEGR